MSKAQSLAAIATSFACNLDPGNPDDVARVVLYAVTQPIDVNIVDIVVRPPKQMDL